MSLTMMLGFNLQNLFRISAIALFEFTQIKFLPYYLPMDRFFSHEGKMHFLNHNLFRLYALSSRLLSSFPSMAFLSVFCALFSRALHASLG